MEVHHHAHTARRKWTHYFWEFLMLFLAVFCGFLAEYKLEQTIERHREKEFMYTMIEDLKKDTTKLSQLDKSLTRIEKSIDTILMNYDELSKRLSPSLYRSIKAIYGYPVFINSDRTIQQLKNSGGMRLIKNKKATDGIMNYDAAVRNYKINDAFIERFWENLTYQRINIIDRHSLENDLKRFGEFKNDKIYLLSNDPLILSKFKNTIYEYSLYQISTKNDQKRLKERASQLINVLKKEYQLK
jgi:hypothetical protein